MPWVWSTGHHAIRVSHRGRVRLFSGWIGVLQKPSPPCFVRRSLQDFVDEPRRPVREPRLLEKRANDLFVGNVFVREPLSFDSKQRLDPDRELSRRFFLDAIFCG